MGAPEVVLPLPRFGVFSVVFHHSCNDWDEVRKFDE